MKADKHFWHIFVMLLFLTCAGPAFAFETLDAPEEENKFRQALDTSFFLVYSSSACLCMAGLIAKSHMKSTRVKYLRSKHEMALENLSSLKRDCVTYTIAPRGYEALRNRIDAISKEIDTLRQEVDFLNNKLHNDTIIGGKDA
ncbi:MAG: hypothetical protein HQK96_16315 [Nitrospirae bacterium]|nr:hypothetical protein [Nitrospirota bacterium]